MIISDEAHFHLNGFINKQNCRIWSTKNPRVNHQHELHPLKCIVVTITGKLYQAMFQNFVIRNRPEMSFHQLADTTMQVLRNIFTKRIISQRSTVDWPSQSPNLTVSYFFLWVI